MISRERVLQFMRARYDALDGLTPERLVQYERNWDAGFLREFALAMERIRETDDILKAVCGKRELSPAVRGWEILQTEDSPEAEQHAEWLRFFYNNLTVANAIDANERGGVGLMIRQQQLAVGYRYALHEIVWQPSSEGITAQLNYAPLWFFENTQGRLRYLATEGALYGQELDPDGWMVTVGPHLMRACARAYLYKHMPMRDWLIYCGRHGMPGIAGKTSAAPGSTAWAAMEDAVAAFAAEFAAVMSKDSGIEKIDLTASGELPYPKLVERMDRAMAALWRGSDLSTLSQGGDSSGASVQADDTEILNIGDALMIAEAANYYLDRQVIWQASGTWTTPKAYFAIRGVTRKNVEQDLKTDDQLWRMGVPLSRSGLAESYGRPAPRDAADTLPPPAPNAAAGIVAANEQPASADVPSIGQFLATAKLQVAEAVQADLLPLAQAIYQLMKTADQADMSDAAYLESLRVFYKTRMPELLHAALQNPAAEKAVADVFAAAFLNGAAAGQEATQ